MTYRNLTQEEINTLIASNCQADDWTNINVKENFSPEDIFNTRFRGTNRLGVFSGYTGTEDKERKPFGIYNSVITDCQIGDQVFISDVRNLCNYHIEDNVFISNVGSLEVTGETTFGNGTEIEVLNEGGGRELPIFDRLSSQIAYLIVLYRHDKEFTGKLLGLIRDYCASKRSAMGTIRSGVRIQDSLIIRNVCIGENTVISGTTLLEEGTIRSCRESPVYIGEGVIAKKFIILSGSRVDGSVIIDKSFIGEGVLMGKQFSCENSLFFANCEAFHGEACSLFAGPYTVTHHKSTLMIANLSSFFNAGSGTNQSNHMYKLGPVHQGIIERGSKTGSFAYLLLPSHIGAYTVIMGKHYSNFDTSDFPFSYITEEKGKSELTPAMNIFTVGTRRDVEKWPKRDRRKNPDKLDLLHFDLFNPYIAGRIQNGIYILNDLADKTPKTQEYVNYKGININRLLLKTTRKYYEMALKIYIGQEIIKRIGQPEKDVSIEQIRKKLIPEQGYGTGKWVELCGMYAPVSEIDKLMNGVKTGLINSVEVLHQSFWKIFDLYERMAWNWCTGLIAQQTGTAIDEITPEILTGLVSDWKINAIKLNNMILKDAEKEFDPGSRLGFGIDGDDEVRDLDFQAVRGTYEENKFVVSLRKEIEEIGEKAEGLVAMLEGL